MSRHIGYIYFIPILFVTIVGTFRMHFDLLAGDWDFWIDWKDREWWPIVTPITAIIFCAALQYYNWVDYRQPFGATITISGAPCRQVGHDRGRLVVVQLSIQLRHGGTLLASAIVLDITQLLTPN